jgi:hypothetical protein
MSTNGQQPKLKLSGVKKHFGSKVVLMASILKSSKANRSLSSAHPAPGNP